MIRFFRLENPPQPHESLEASQSYCEDLEQRVVELKQKCRDLEDEINSLQNDLANSYHSQEEAKGLAAHYEIQYSSQGSALQVRCRELMLNDKCRSRSRETAFHLGCF